MTENEGIETEVKCRINNVGKEGMKKVFALVVVRWERMHKGISMSTAEKNMEYNISREEEMKCITDEEYMWTNT